MPSVAIDNVSLSGSVQLNQAEGLVYGQTHPLVSSQQRVGDLEKKLYGSVETGTLDGRINKISQTLGTNSQILNTGVTAGKLPAGKTVLSGEVSQSQIPAAISTNAMPPAAPSFQRAYSGSANANAGYALASTQQASASTQQQTAKVDNSHTNNHETKRAGIQAVGMGLSAVGLGALHCPVCELLGRF